MRIKLLASLLLAVPLFASPADEVKNAETAFAKAFADRDAKAFFAMVDEGATFLGGGTTDTGRDAVVKRWSAFFEPKQAPFTWRPARVVTNEKGDMGLSMGPIFDPAGNEVGQFSSVWQKKANGEWKVIFDGPGGPPIVEEGFVTTDDGVRLHYRKTGRGPRVVIVPFSVVLFDDLRRLADTATVIAYDMRSRGRSDRADDSLSIDREVADLEAVRRHFNIDRFTPIGYSYLGKMVALYALAHPSRVERLVQIGPIAIDAAAKFERHGTDDVGAPAEDVARFREARGAGMPEKSPKEFCELDHKVMQFVLVGDSKSASKLPNLCAYENEYPFHLTSAVFPKVISSIEARKLTHEEAKKIAVPVLTIHGTKDRNAAYAGGKDWADTLPDGRLLTVDGAAHAVYAERSDIVIPAIRMFVRGEWPAEAK